MVKGLFSFLVLLTLLGCTKMDIYEPNQIYNARFSVSDKTLHYQVELDTLYFSPGLVRDKNKPDCYRVVRCSINKKCPVDIESSITEGVYSAQLPQSTGETICFVGNSSKTLTLP